MLPREYRLTFQQFASNPKPLRKCVSPRLVFLIKPSLQKYSQVVMVVPKRIDKRSTSRNKTKRIITEGIYALLPRVTPSYSIMIKARRILQKEDLPEVVRDFTQCVVKKGTYA